MENFNSELYEKCIAASELLFTDILSQVATTENLSDEIIEIIKEDNAKNLYNLAIGRWWTRSRTEQLVEVFKDDPSYPNLFKLIKSGHFVLMG